MTKNEILRFGLDTNILIYLADYIQKPEELKKDMHAADFYAVKYLDMIINEEMDKGRDKKLFLSFPTIVVYEILKGLWQGKEGLVMKYTRCHEIEPLTVIEKDRSTTGKIFNILMGKDAYRPDEKALFHQEDVCDCWLVTQCAFENIPVLTQNFKHFWGPDGKTKKAIEGRLMRDSEHISLRNNGRGCANCKIYSIQDLIREHYPEHYKNMQSEIRAAVKEINQDCGK